MTDIETNETIGPEASSLVDQLADPEVRWEAYGALVELGDEALPAVRDGLKNGHWQIPKVRLPLNEMQRRALQKKANEIRRTVEEALPSRTGGRSSRVKHLADLAASAGVVLF